MSNLTLSQILYESIDKHAKLPALKWKQGDAWAAMSYEDLGRRVQDFAAGLASLGLAAGDRVALFSRNCPQWAVADWACVAHGLASVPIYDTLTADKAAYILKDSDAKAVVVQSKEHLDKIRSVRKGLPKLKYIIVIEEIFEKSLESGELLFDRVYEKGAEYRGKHATALKKLASQVKPDDIASIVYTSGTTGEPKGALLTQNNFASNVESALSVIPFEPRDVALSFLPLSHVFERMGGHFTMIRVGATIAYAESIEKVPQNLAEVRPHVMLSVPRLYEKIYARIRETVNQGSFIKKYFFRKASEVGKEWVHAKYDLKVDNPGVTRKWKRYDRLVFHKLRDRVGGRLKFFVSGGAPLSPEIQMFFTAAGMPILQGYGLTETSPVLCANTLTDFRVGSVGKPIPGAEIKIGEDGEILAKGPMIFKGYHNKADATKEVFTKDGYFRTGDIGRIDEDGFVYVTDRKKELLVMSNGKKVAPQPIENELKLRAGIGMAVLIGDDRPYITALLSPDMEALTKYADDHGIKVADQNELLTRKEILELFEQGVGAVNESLARYEKIKRFRILPAELTQESGELTPTLKVKRRVVDQKYGDLIASLYGPNGGQS